MKLFTVLMFASVSIAQNLILVSGPGPSITGTMYINRVNVDLSSTAIISQRITAGAFNAVSLRSNTSTLAGTYYTVTYNNALNVTVATEYWTVPASPAITTRGIIFSSSTGGAGVLALNGLSGNLTFPTPAINNVLLLPSWNVLGLNFPLASGNASAIGGLLTGAEYLTLAAKAQTGTCPVGQAVTQLNSNSGPTCAAVSGSSLTIQNINVPQTPRSILNFPKVDGIDVSMFDDGTRTNIAISPDLTYMAPVSQVQSGALLACNGTGVNTIVCLTSVSGAPYTAYPASLVFCTASANTAAATITLSVLSPRGLKKWGGADLASGDLVAGGCYTAVNQAANYWVREAGASSGSSVTEINMPFGECYSGGPGVMTKLWSIPAGFTDPFGCPGNTPFDFVKASFSNSTAMVLRRRIMIPSNWSGSSPVVVMRLGEGPNFGSGNVKFDVSLTCVPEGVSFYNPTLNTAGTTGTVLVNTSGGTGGTSKKVTISSVPTTGCVAGTSDWGIVSLTRDTTIGGYANPIDVMSFVIRFI